MAAYEAVIIMVLLIALGFAIWFLLSKETQSNIFHTGSNPKIDNINRRDYPLSIHIGEGGCVHRLLLNKEN